MQNQNINNNNNISDINVSSRKKIRLTGVKKIFSLNEEEFNIETTLGIIQIKGINLSMTDLNLEKGLLEIIGLMNEIKYLEKEIKNKDKKENIFRKIFKWYIH